MAGKKKKNTFEEIMAEIFTNLAWNINLQVEEYQWLSKENPTETRAKR